MLGGVGGDCFGCSQGWGGIGLDDGGWGGIYKMNTLGGWDCVVRGGVRNEK